MDNVWILDIEVFKGDWLIIAHSIDTGDRLVIHNDTELAQAFVNDVEPVLGGYNAKFYDMHIMRCIWLGAPYNIIKECNDWIISGEQGWAFPWFKYKPKLPVNVFDLMDDIPVPLRLKEIEANLGMSVQESAIAFGIDRELTREEVEEVIRYCHHDVDATVELWKKRQDYLTSKINVGAMKNIPWQEAICLTNAKLTARFLEAQRVERFDEFEYEFPENLRVGNDKVLDFFKNIDYERKLECLIADTPHVVAWGGLHGAVERYAEEMSENREIASYDVASYYPSLMIEYGYMSRNVPNPEEYREIYHRRLEAKRNGDKKTADAFKLVLNTAYGAMKNQYNDLYDPKMANAVCISGQLFLIDLIEKLEKIPTVKLIQSNTDGIIISYDKSKKGAVAFAIKAWEIRTRFTMEKTIIKKIVQKDVNNYIISSESGNIKVKGGYVSNWNGGDWKNSSLAIIDKAVVKYLIDNVPPEETVASSRDEWKLFQMVAKTGRTYDATLYYFDDKAVPVQSTNRIFATTSPVCGTIYKVKDARDGKKPRKDKVANAPEHCFIDNSDDPKPLSIDLGWYAEMAWKRIHDYTGGKHGNDKKTENE